VTSSRFNFHLKTGSTFAVEKDGTFMGYVATQTIDSIYATINPDNTASIKTTPKTRLHGQELEDSSAQNQQ